MSTRLAITAERVVGRTREIARLEAACVAARRGRGSVTVISGEPGVGKTRLCEEVAERASSLGLTVAAARCWPGGGAPAFWPWQPILRDVCGNGAADLLGSEHGPAVADGDRFARFAAVTDRLRAACAGSPVCLIIDDVHAADAGTLLLTRFIARSLPGLPLALVLARRDSEPRADRTTARLLDDIEREAVPLVVPGLDPEESAELLAADGLTGLDSGLAVALHGLTGGNPLFLRRVAALGRPGPGDQLPGGLQVAIEQALARLSPEAQRVLRASAVLVGPVSVACAADVAETGPATIVDAVREAAAAGLVSTEGPDRFAFSHDLIRAAVEEKLPGADRLDAHARAAEAVVADGPSATEPLGRRAHHALTAAARSVEDARRAVAACEAAAASAGLGFAFERADELLSAAVGLHEGRAMGPPPARLLVRWAEAALRCGRLAESRDRFDRAVAAAQREGDPALFAEAALGLGGHWVNEYRAPVERARVLGLQRSALAGLSAEHEVLRCRLAMRLAAEAVFDGAPVAPVRAALDAVRRCGDRFALAEALSLCHHVLFTPEHAHDRGALADELVRVASESEYGVLGLMGLCWRVADLFCLGDERAVAALEDLRERATALASQHIVYMVGVIDVMLLIRAGRLDEAEAEAGRCYELGEAIGEIDAYAYLSGQIGGVRWIQGRDAELLEMAEAMVTSPTLSRAEFAFRAAAAAITARAGHHEQARAQLASLTAGGLGGLPASSTWLVGMVALVEAAAAVGDAGVAREAYDLMRPYAGLPTIGSVAVLCLGSTERGLGIAARTFGDGARAVEHLERALAENRRLGHRPLVAITAADLADSLSRRDRPGDRDAAVGLLERAVRDAEAMSMAARADAWRERLGGLRRADDAAGDGGDDGKGEDDGEDGREGTARRGAIRREGARWVVALDGMRVRVADLTGMGHLAELLTRPGALIPALTLANPESSVREPARQEMLDEEARTAYASRARELGADLADAEANNDLVRAERLRVELDTLVDHVKAATGLNGRSRAFSDPAERARTAVRKAIKRAIDAIDDANPALAENLRSTITTGIACSYTPDLRKPVVWSTGPPEDGAGGHPRGGDTYSK